MKQQLTLLASMSQGSTTYPQNQAAMHPERGDQETENHGQISLTFPKTQRSPSQKLNAHLPKNSTVQVANDRGSGEIRKPSQAFLVLDDKDQTAVFIENPDRPGEFWTYSSD